MKTGTSLNRFIQHLFMCLLCLNGLTAQADDNIITHTGDRYIIHVDKMNPDSEMTLMDVLHTCPEFLSLDGKTISSQYSFRIDNIEIFLDRETFLTHLKACEIERIHICTNASVSKAVDGTRGVIDIYYRRDAKTDGKVALSGSTYGNGKVYADIISNTEKLTVRGYALARTSYGKAYPADISRITDHAFIENLHLSMDWKQSDNDNLILKATQGYDDTKQKLFNPDLIGTIPNYFRTYALILSYAHTFKNKAILFAETGDYSWISSGSEKKYDTYPYLYLEFNTPLFTPDLWLMVGSEMDYENIRNDHRNRQQTLLTDLYAQLDYAHGPWLITLGDRYRMMNYWNRQYDSPDRSLWSHQRNNHQYIASVGYKARRHFFQALFTRRFHMPMMDDFLADETAPATSLRYSSKASCTHLIHQGVLRYTYQQNNLVLHSSIENNWYRHLPGQDLTQFGLRNSLYWKTRAFDLTIGANYYHQHQRAGAGIPSDNDNFFTLKAAPVLRLPYGLRLSSVLLYSSRRDIEQRHAHLYATVKGHKQIGEKCSLFAEYHDLGGYTTGEWSQLPGLYQNRALTIGATFYPFR